MKEKIKITLLGLLLMLWSGLGTLYGATVDPGTDPDLKCYLEDDYEIPASGGSVKINLKEVADRMYANAGITGAVSFGAESTCSGAQQLQFSVAYGPSPSNNNATFTFAANTGITYLSNTITIKITSKTALNFKFPYALIVCNFSQSPSRVYNMNVIQGLKVTETNHNGSTYKTTVSYFDGYGRIEQNIGRGASPKGDDIVSFYKYDNMGRKDAVSYMPYVQTGTLGAKRADPVAEQKTFYQKLFEYPDDYNYAYSSKKYEKSPLGLVEETGGSGKTYSLDGGADRRTTTFAYGKLSGESIPKYMVNASSQLVLEGNYPAGMLTKKSVTSPMTDTQDSMTDEFYDSHGRIVAKAVWVGASTKMTCYAYDEFGRLRYTIPPVVKDELGVTPRTMNPDAYRKYWFYDEYDARGRVIKSIKPGKEDEYFVYDYKDRLVMSQDGNMRAGKKWVVCKYDSWGRVEAKTVYKDTRSVPRTRENMQAMFDAALSPDISTASGFDVDIYLSRYEYDEDVNDYRITGKLVFVPVEGVVAKEALAVKDEGRLLYERVAMLPVTGGDESMGNIERTYYYDRKGRVVQSVEYDKFSGMTSRVSTKYNFEGQPLVVVEEHTQKTYTDYKRTDYQYDNYGRLKKETTATNLTMPVTVSYSYDESGNLSSKMLNYNNKNYGEQYEYNIQGALLSQDSQHLLVDYIYDESNSSYDSEARYDGNLSMVASVFKQSIGFARKNDIYAYDYDNMGQLTAGRFFTASGKTTSYNENTSYDSYGRITSMRRVGSTLADENRYTYNYDGNRLSDITHSKGGTSTVYRYSYDANGNLSQDDRKKLFFDYNCLNLLSCIIDKGAGPKAYYVWLADGTKYAVMSSPYPEVSRMYKGSFTYEDTGGYAIESIIFNGGQFTMDSNHELQPSFILSDNLGSSRVVMDGSFKVLVRNSYYPYGQIHSENIYDAQLLKVLNRFQFNGKEKQTFSYNTDFGLLDYGARMYDPVLGLWTTQDPAYQFVNPYMFCGNNPVNYIDKDGQFAFALVAGFMMGGAINLWLNAIMGNSADTGRDILMQFGLGGLAGSIGAGVGGLIAGSVGSFGFYAGMLSGAGGGAAGGAAQGAFNTWLNGGSFKQGMHNALIGGGIGALAGGILGGLGGGIAAKMNGGNFWNGNGVTFDFVDTGGIVEPGREIPYNNESAKAFSDKYFGEVKGLNKLYANNSVPLNENGLPQYSLNANGDMIKHSSGGKSLGTTTVTSYGSGKNLYDVYLYPKAFVSPEKLYTVMGHEYAHIHFYLNPFTKDFKGPAHELLAHRWSDIQQYYFGMRPHLYNNQITVNGHLFDVNYPKFYMQPTIK